MATIPEQYESQRVGVQGYRVLNLDLDGVCADYKGAIRDYLQRQGIDVPERALQTAHYNLTREDGWPFSMTPTNSAFLNFFLISKNPIR